MNLLYTALKEDNERELKSILKNKLMLSGTLIKKIKKHNGFLVNGVPVYVIHKLTEGDNVEVVINFEDKSQIIPENIDIDIIYEDEYIIIINKQPGYVVHPTRAHLCSTLANALKYHYTINGSNAGIHPVTRLDKETSGIILFAKNPFIHNLMIKQMRENLIYKEYSGIILGHMEKPSGIIDLPIERSPGERMLREINYDGKESLTQYEVREAHKYTSYVKFVLETGRTHQIRVHCKALGHPLAGDKLYGDPAYETGHGLEGIMLRQALHSSKCIFTHPVTNREIEITAELPEDMSNALDLFRFI